MEFLETFDVSGCSKLKMIPEFVGQTKRLSKLCLGGTAVEKLPSSIEHLSESLVGLDLSGIVIREQPYSLFLKQNVIASSLGLFPRKSHHPLIPVLASLKHFSSLKELNLNDCNLCEGEIPNDIGSLSSLECLELGGNNFVSLPASIHLLCRLTEKLPWDACNSKWIGFAVCALIVPQDNPSAVPEDPDLDPDTCLISCNWSNYGINGVVGRGLCVRQFDSDHLWLLVLPSPFRKPKNCREVNFVFQTARAVGNNRCMKVKKCGVRALYEHDTEELISKMNQPKSSSVSLYEEAMDEQEGAMVKAATSGSGGSGNEYYPAE